MTTLLIVLAFSVAAPGTKDAPTKETPHVGTWTISKLVIGGEEFPGKGEAIVFEADGKRSNLDTDGKKQKNVGTVKVDTSKTPFEMDIVEDVAGKKKTSKAIFKIEGETLTICSDVVMDEAARPKKFESPAGSQMVLMVLKRVKKD